MFVLFDFRRFSRARVVFSKKHFGSSESDDLFRNIVCTHASMRGSTSLSHTDSEISTYLSSTDESFWTARIFADADCPSESGLYAEEQRGGVDRGPFVVAGKRNDSAPRVEVEKLLQASLQSSNQGISTGGSILRSSALLRSLGGGSVRERESAAPSQTPTDFSVKKSSKV